MVTYLFHQNMGLNVLPFANEINFFHHINMIDWPVLHGHKDYWEFVIVLNGNMRVLLNGKKTTWQTGHLYCSTTKDTHSVHFPNGETARYINIMVREAYLLNLLNAVAPELIELLNQDDFHLNLSNNEISTIESVLQNIDTTNTLMYRQNDALICSAFLIILSACIKKQNDQGLHPLPWQQELTNLARNYNLLSFTVNDLCKALGYSRVQLNTLFKKYYNNTPHNYLIDYKFNHARTLLLNTNLTVAAIANEIGYSNTRSFYETFKKLFNMTPKDYRRLHHSPQAKPNEE